MNQDNYLVFLFLAVFCFSSCKADIENYPRLFRCSENIDEAYGICSHINRKSDKYEFDTKAKEMLMIERLGAEWIRTDFDRGVFLTSSRDSLSFSHFDCMMAAISPTDKQVLGIFSNLAYQNQLPSWKLYVERVAKHYGSSIKCWEIINEADIKYKKLPDYSSSNYATLLKSGYHIIKSIDPQAKVLISGLAHANGSFLDSIIMYYDGRNCFDIMNFHHYSNKNNEPEEFILYFNQLSKRFKRLEIHKPVWLTETGCSSTPNWTNEIIQAQRLPRIYLISLAFGIEKVFWYKSRSNELSNQDSSHFGLWHKDYTPKPAFYAYQNLIKMCPDKSVRPVLRRQEDVYIAQWKRPDGKKVYALWTSKKSIIVRLSIMGRYSCFNINGKELHVEPRDVVITPSILYFVGEQRFKLEIKK